jgi:hypothetical protein
LPSGGRTIIARVATNPEQLKREFLTAAITDLEGTIHANDTKCSAALVTHGLVFAGLVTVSAAAAHLYPQADHTLRALALGLGGAGLVAFLVSIICLLLAVMPYRPKKLDELIDGRTPKPPGAFFPKVKGEQDIKSEQDALEAQVKAVAGLTEKGAINDLTCESVKLADIRDHERTWARRGYRALIVELVFAAGYLAVVAIAARGTV